MCHTNLDPIRQYLFRSNSNKFLNNSAERKFTYLPAEHICDLVSNQGSPLTVSHTFLHSSVLTYWHSTLRNLISSIINCKEQIHIFFSALSSSSSSAWPWTWRHYDLPKRRYPLTSRHGVTLQRTPNLFLSFFLTSPCLCKLQISPDLRNRFLTVSLARLLGPAIKTLPYTGQCKPVRLNPLNPELNPICFCWHY